MPKGQKQIDWTAENDARLILTILAVENIHPNCENVAAAFGESEPDIIIKLTINFPTRTDLTTTNRRLRQRHGHRQPSESPAQESRR